MEQRKKEKMDYAGEFLVLFYVLGIVLLILSFTTIRFNAFEWGSLLLAVIIMNFFVPFHKLFIYLGFPIEYIKKSFKKG